jgi:hypothetical protein
MGDMGRVTSDEGRTPRTSAWVRAHTGKMLFPKAVCELIEIADGLEQKLSAVLPKLHDALSELAEAKETISRLNRRCQRAEGGVAQFKRQWQEAGGPRGGSFGRALLAAECARVQANGERLKAEICKYFHQEMEPVPDYLVEALKPWLIDPDPAAEAGGPPVHEADCGYTVTGHAHNCSCPAGDKEVRG